MELILEENMNKFTNQLGENTVDLQKQLIEGKIIIIVVRGDVNKLAEDLTHARS